MRSSGVVGAVLLLAAAGCGASNGAPESVVRSYERAIVSRDGDTLCATFAPKLRQVLAEQIASSKRESATRSAPRLSCGQYFHLLIGYPHENVDRRFLSGKLLEVGAARRVSRAGVVYLRVPAKLKIQFAYSGYSTHRNGQRGSKTFDDVVWLAREGKTWAVVKPSLGLLAASSPDLLYEAYQVAHANAAPPDPDYSMTRAERTAAEGADYRASFRRTIGHGPIPCPGGSVSVADRPHDAVANVRRPPFQTVAAPSANEIARVTVRTAGYRMCVAVTFRRKPAGHLLVSFAPRSHRTPFSPYVVEVVPSRGTRGGQLASSYRYFRANFRVDRAGVAEIARYERTIAFVADARAGHRRAQRVPTDLEWIVRATVGTASDEVPDRASAEYLAIRQRDGRAVRPRSR